MLHEAKRILLSDFESDISLQQLCRAVGINEFKLKKGFKHLFGDTVFGYRHTVRMEKAKQIILETKLDFSDIAFMTGFEHPSNFHKAFKKFHGFTAAELRKYGRVG
jgi:AraC-like DNA-binding protein